MLPKIDVPTFRISLPSDERIIQVRPFLVKEEKILLIAAESKDPEEMTQAILQVIDNCIVDAGQDPYNLDRRPFFDIEYLFTALRAKSISENIDINFQCNQMDGEDYCGNIFEVKLDILEAQVSKSSIDISDKIEFSSTAGVKMKYPSYKDANTTTENGIDRKINLIQNSIDYIYDGETIHSRKDISEEELSEFIDNLTSDQFNKMEFWVNNLPSLMIEKTRVCEKCKYEHKLVYDDFDSFFL